MGQASAKLTSDLSTYTPTTSGTTSQAKFVQWNTTDLPVTITYDNSVPSGYTWRCDFTLTNGSDVLVCGLVREYLGGKNKYTLTLKLGTVNVKYYKGKFSFTELSVPIEASDNIIFTNFSLTQTTRAVLSVHDSPDYYHNGDRYSKEVDGNIEFDFDFNSNGTRTLATVNPNNRLYYFNNPPYNPLTGKLASNPSVVEANYNDMRSNEVQGIFSPEGILSYTVDTKREVFGTIRNVAYVEWTASDTCPSGFIPSPYCDLVNSYTADPVTKVASWNITKSYTYTVTPNV